MRLTPRSGARYGAAFGLVLTVVMLIGAAIKFAGGASWETLEWAGTVAPVIAFPLSQLLYSLSGWAAHIAVVVAPILNWTLLGLLGGVVGSAVNRAGSSRAQ